MRIRGMSLIAVGIVVVALDLRIVALDMLPDVLGWLLVAAGAWKLAQIPPAALAVVAAIASAPDLLAAHHWDAIDPMTGEVVPEVLPGLDYPEVLAFDRLSGLRLALALLAVVAGGLALWSLLGTLSARARALGDAHSAGRLSILRWLVPAVWVVPYVLVAVVQWRRDDGFDPVWNGGYEGLALAALAVLAAIGWVLAVNSNRAWTATDEERVTPWADLLMRRSA